MFANSRRALAHNHRHAHDCSHRHACGLDHGHKNKAVVGIMCSCIRVRMFRFRYRQFSCYDLLQFRLDELWKLNIFFWSSLCNKLRTLPKKTLDIQMNCSCRGNIYISTPHELMSSLMIPLCGFDLIQAINGC